jgi:hypothetical protein
MHSKRKLDVLFFGREICLAMTTECKCRAYRPQLQLVACLLEFLEPAYFLVFQVAPFLLMPLVEQFPFRVPDTDLGPVIQVQVSQTHDGAIMAVHPRQLRFRGQGIDSEGNSFSLNHIYINARDIQCFYAS